MSSGFNHLYEFDEFRLNTENPGLWRNGQFMPIVPKALDVLILLVKRQGEVVSREDLLESVWRETFFEDSNVSYTISLLRKTLGEKEFIRTVPKRGYCFSATVNRVSENGTSPVATSIDNPTKQTRWVLLSVSALSLVFMTSFVFLRQPDSLKSAAQHSSAQADASLAYTRGKLILENRSVENRRERAIDEFQKAITLDPTFALAYVGLAEGFAATAAGGVSGDQSRSYYAKAKAAAQKGLSLNANLAEGLSIDGWLKHQVDWNFHEAEIDLRRAAHLAPDNALIHFRLSRVLIPLGRPDEAYAEIKKAYELDPASEIMLSGRFPILEIRGDYDEGLKLAEGSLRDNKENPSASRAYATFLYHKGDFAKVIDLSERALEKKNIQNAFGWLSLLAGAQHKIGDSEKADEILKQLEILGRDNTKALYALVMNYAESGRHDEAFIALQKCFEQREEKMIWMKNEPRFANLRNDSRYQDILQRMKL